MADSIGDMLHAVNGDESHLPSYFIAGIAIITVIVAVFTQNKYVAALAQIGGLQEREAAADAFHAAKTVKRTLRMQDKIAFTLGAVNIMATAFLIGAAPVEYYKWHSPGCTLLIFMRWRVFRTQKKQNLLWDFCYWANFLALYYVWLAPDDARLFQIVFMCANGPLAWSVLAFNHALIFHSWQHITSLVIHTSPMLLTYGIRWHGNVDGSSGFQFCNAEDEGGCNLPAVTMVANALTYFYVPWMVLYYTWVFLVMGKHIKEKGFKTLYDRCVNKWPFAYFLAKADQYHPQLFRSGLDLVRKSVYMMVHLCFGIITMYVATFLWRSQVAHGMFIVTLMVASAWNGAGFYFQLFSREYEQRMDEKVEQKVLQKEETKTDQNDQTDQGKKAAARGRSPARRTSSRSRSGSRTRTAKKAK